MKLAKTCETRECMRSREKDVKILHVRGYMRIHMINDHAKTSAVHIRNQFGGALDMSSDCFLVPLTSVH